MSRPRINIDAELPRLIRRYNEGLSINVLARPLGLSYETLRRRLQMAGVELRRNPNARGDGQPGADPNSFWSADELARLAELWATELSAAAIGLALGKSKNAVTGKAKRLGLPSRGSPLKPLTAEEKVSRLRAQTEAKFARALEKRLRQRALDEKALRAMAERPAPRLAIVPRVEAPDLSPDALPGQPRCQYIAGEPGPTDDCKCPKVAVPDSSYCARHHALCWVGLPVRKKRAA